MLSPLTRRAISLSIAAAAATLFLKSLAYYFTGSVGLFSDAAEAVVNLLASVGAFLSLWYASRPVDPSHTYGHEKMEYFASGMEGGLILAGGAGVIWYSIRRFFQPEPLESLGLGAILSGLATLINLLVARILLRAGQVTGSIVLEADGRHLMTDVWSSAAVLIGLVLVSLTGQPWLDALVGLLVSVNIVRTAFDLVRRSLNGLLDHALPDAEVEAVRAAIESQLAAGMDYHALRTRQAGPRRFADFHLLVPGVFSVRRAHEITGRVENAIQAALANIEVTVHIEPIEDRTAWEDSELLPMEEAARRARQEKGP